MLLHPARLSPGTAISTGIFIWSNSIPYWHLTDFFFILRKEKLLKRQTRIKMMIDILEKFCETWKMTEGYSVRRISAKSAKSRENYFGKRCWANKRGKRWLMRGRWNCHPVWKECVFTLRNFGNKCIGTFFLDYDENGDGILLYCREKAVTACFYGKLFQIESAFYWLCSHWLILGMWGYWECDIGQCLIQI